MNIFPSIEKKFKLIDNQTETLNRLNRRTEKSENLTSQYTDKSFRGIIDENEFKIISSAIGKGAFCVMSGKIDSEKGNVKVEIHKVFRILLSIILCFPIIGMDFQIRSRAFSSLLSYARFELIYSRGGRDSYGTLAERGTFCLVLVLVPLTTIVA